MRISRVSAAAVCMSWIPGALVFAAPTNAAPFSNCDQARAAGAAPISVGQPGYSRKLDRDGDGIACDTGSGSGYVPAAPFVPAQPAPATQPTPPEPGPSAASTAATPAETCTDWMKLRINPATGLEEVCGPIGSPAYVYYWIDPQPMPGGVHDAGSPCPGVEPHIFARSIDDYQIWCASAGSIRLPGDRWTDSPQPAWGLYSP